MSLLLRAAVALAVTAYAARFAYNQFDQEIHHFVESNEPLRDFRNYLRLWPHPSDYLECEPLPPLPTARFEAASVTVGGDLFVFGGFDRPRLKATAQCLRFDPDRREWTELAPIPMVLTHMGVAVVEGRVWLAGGFEGDHPGTAVADVWIYDIAQDSWAAGPPLPEPRAGGALVLLDGALHYFGGSRADRRTDSADHWRVDLGEGDTWQPRAGFPSPRHHFSAAVLDGIAYAIGGQVNHDDLGRDTDAVHSYNPIADEWTAVSSLPRARSHFEPGTFVWREQICVSGGERGMVQVLYDIECYDPTADVWRAAPALPEPIRAPIVQPLDGGWFVGAGGPLPLGLRPDARARLCKEPAYPRVGDAS